MSYWTTPAVIISVHYLDGMPMKELQREVDIMLKGAPLINGSEGNIKPVAFNFVEGTWRNGVNLADRFMIVLCGHLRDKFYEDTDKDIKSFIKYLKNYGKYRCKETGRIVTPYFVDIISRRIYGQKYKNLKENE